MATTSQSLLKCLYRPSQFVSQSSPTHSLQSINYFYLRQPSRLCSSNSANREDKIRQSFMSKYQNKIRSSTTAVAWSRHQKDQASPSTTTTPEDEHKEGFVTPEYDTPEEAKYDPHSVFGIPRATFRGLVIGISCLIGATLFVILKPDAIVSFETIPLRPFPLYIF